MDEGDDGMGLGAEALHEPDVIYVVHEVEQMIVNSSRDQVGHGEKREEAEESDEDEG